MVKSKTKIEDRGISILKSLVSKHDLLREELKSNDKTEAVDGVIKLYKNNPDKKNNLVDDNIKVQVKTTTKCSQKHKDKVRVSLKDIKVFQKIDGVIYFKIYIYEDETYEIYYKKFLPVNLIPIIKKNSSKQTITINFKKLQNYNHLHEIVFDFSRDRKKQTSFNNLENSDLFLDGIKLSSPFTIHGLFNPELPLINNIIGKEYTAYEKITIPVNGKTIPLEIPRTEIVINQIQENKTIINNKTFDVKKTFLQDGKVLLGESFILDSKNGKFDINLKGTLSNRIEELKCFLEISPKPLNNESQKVFDFLTNELEIYRKIQKSFKKFGITKDLEYDNLNDKDISNLNHLLNIVINNNTIPFKIEHNTFYTNITIANITMCVLALKDDSTGGFILENYYSNKKHDFKIEYSDGNSLKFNNKYLVLNSEHFQSDNFIKKNVVDSIDINKAYDDNELDLINLMILQIINAYDKTLNEELIICARECIDKLLKIEDQIIFKVNKWQILYRQKKLNKDDILEINRIIDTNESNELVMFSLYTLIGDKTNATTWNNRINNEELKQLRSQPIYTLYQNL